MLQQIISNTVGMCSADTASRYFYLTPMDDCGVVTSDASQYVEDHYHALIRQACAWGCTESDAMEVVASLYTYIKDAEAEGNGYCSDLASIESYIYGLLHPRVKYRYSVERNNHEELMALQDYQTEASEPARDAESIELTDAVRGLVTHQIKGVSVGDIILKIATDGTDYSHNPIIVDGLRALVSGNPELGVSLVQVLESLQTHRELIIDILQRSRPIHAKK